MALFRHQRTILKLAFLWSGAKPSPRTISYYGAFFVTSFLSHSQRLPSWFNSYHELGGSTFLLILPCSSYFRSLSTTKLPNWSINSRHTTRQPCSVSLYYCGPSSLKEWSRGFMAPLPAVLKCILGALKSGSWYITRKATRCTLQIALQTSKRHIEVIAGWKIENLSTFELCCLFANEISTIRGCAFQLSSCSEAHCKESLLPGVSKHAKIGLQNKNNWRHS